MKHRNVGAGSSSPRGAGTKRYWLTDTVTNRNLWVGRPHPCVLWLVVGLGLPALAVPVWNDNDKPTPPQIGTSGWEAPTPRGPGMSPNWSRTTAVFTLRMS